MRSVEIRRSFIDFFVERGHRELPSAPLVPHGDPTLLFTNAGMVPFKERFLGNEPTTEPRVVTVQKCMRVSGKHNDLENVGPSPRHHTFFEMLGNFSFGDYFKEDAIRFGWELVHEVWGLPFDHLTATVFEEDDEAAELWAKVSGLPSERIIRCGTKDNFWAMGDTGPCGPCSEIFVDTEPQRPKVSWSEGTESGRYLEIWNLVFMQYDRDAGGELRPLPDPSIDTGAGLERVAAVLQGVLSNYDTDLFTPLLEATAQISGRRYGRDAETDTSFRVIADHVRAVAFLLADGVIPGNEGRAYVLRRILRRALRHGMTLGFEEPFLFRLMPVIGELMGDSYPELQRAQTSSQATVEAEEEKFLSTVASASRQVQEVIDEIRQSGRHELPGEAVFRFYDTFGMPLELIHEIAEEEKIEVDDAGFQKALETQRQRSRAAVGDAKQQLAGARDALREAAATATEFLGYSQLELHAARVLGLAQATADGTRSVQALSAGDAGVIVLDRTPFYAESGGQLGDRGHLFWGGGAAAIVDTQRDPAGVTYHFVTIDRGRIERGASVEAKVDASWRVPTERNHTATHLLHLALRHVLGEGARQAGSLVAPDRLRFDFTFHRSLTTEEINRIEELVNRWALTSSPTSIESERAFKEALDAGAMALFGEKYGERVRTVQVGPLASDDSPQELTSLELCGGCHVRNTGEIGLFLITAERGVASGVRRIEALTGEGARRAALRQRELLAQVAGELAVDEGQAPTEIAAWKKRAKDLERELAHLRMRFVSGGSDDRPREVAGVKVISREVPPAPVNEIRNMADVLRGKLGSGVVVLGSRDEEKVTLVVAVSDDLTQQIHAGRLAKAVAALVGGSGGGRADFAQAGGKEPDRLPDALEQVPRLAKEQLEN